MATIHEFVVRVYANFETWVYCFLCRCNPAIENQRRFEHVHIRTHVVALNTKTCKEPLGHFLDQQGLDVIPDLFPLSGFSTPETPF